MDTTVGPGTETTAAAAAGTSCCGLPEWALHEPLAGRGTSPLCALPEWDAGDSTQVHPGAGAIRIPLVRDRRLYVAGSVGDCVYVLKAGVVKHIATADDGRNAVVRLVTAGGVSGLEAIAGLPYRHSAIVLHPGSACRIPVEIIRRYEELDSEAAKQLSQAWQQAVDDSERLLRMTHGPALLRVASLLQFLREAIPAGELIRIRRADIADLFALTEVSVARALSELRKRGLIAQSGNGIAHIDAHIAALAGTPAPSGDATGPTVRAVARETVSWSAVRPTDWALCQLGADRRGKPEEAHPEVL